MVHLTGCIAAPDWPRMHGYHPVGAPGAPGSVHSAFAGAAFSVYNAVSASYAEHFPRKMLLGYIMRK